VGDLQIHKSCKLVCVFSARASHFARSHVWFVLASLLFGVIVIPFLSAVVVRPQKIVGKCVDDNRGSVSVLFENSFKSSWLQQSNSAWHSSGYSLPIGILGSAWDIEIERGQAARIQPPDWSVLQHSSGEARARSRLVPSYRIVHAYGWPSRWILSELSCESDGCSWIIVSGFALNGEKTTNNTNIYLIPSFILWKGLAINIICWSGVGAFSGFWCRVALQSRRRRSNKCPHCAYSKKNNDSLLCPECGEIW
jgi:hypothetical protein